MCIRDSVEPALAARALRVGLPPPPRSRLRLSLGSLPVRRPCPWARRLASRPRPARPALPLGLLPA
eukprot:7191091-Alexandrium_andersonii.AAC.1